MKITKNYLLISVILISLAISAFTFIRLRQSYQSDNLMDEIVSASQLAEKKYPLQKDILHRTSIFVEKLENINVERAPEDLRKAFNTYLKYWKLSEEALRKSGNLFKYDSQTKQATEDLKTIAKRY